MAASLFHLLLLFTNIILSSSSYSDPTHSLNRGSSLFVENKDDLLVSPNGLFTAGFHQAGQNAYVFAVWFRDHTVVWMANRDAPENGKNSKLSLWKDGNLVLLDAGLYIIWSTKTESKSSSVQLRLHNTGFRKFTYSELKKASRNFSEEIGRGGASIVYKARLEDNRIAAIKKLTNSDDQGEDEFQAEISTIGRMIHMNLIETWGYCAEGKHRLVSDFGLSKRSDRSGVDQWNFSMMRGTRGYMAPEWVLNLPITSKVDVFSFGVVMLEMITGRSPTHTRNEQPGLIEWVRDLVKRECWVEEVTEASIRGEFDECMMEELVRIALQCTEEDREARPTMSQVVNMLLHM
ncbi:hypothetical protein L1987_32352 [Smallanthus sonchifolius]|uniref:Uncharacterized protein n=1 Tax=Smallanthus sonchifolius TaxID=185202 RepID=A0ACB9I907_9ASTR|nr:hypothetical protein L1987_32352 [Smallanthus sonchifolius]